MPRQDRNSIEIRIKARLAWNNWPDTPLAREAIARHEARDTYSADAWDRVADAIFENRLLPS